MSACSQLVLPSPPGTADYQPGERTANGKISGGTRAPKAVGGECPLLGMCGRRACVALLYTQTEYHSQPGWQDSMRGDHRRSYTVGDASPPSFPMWSCPSLHCCLEQCHADVREPNRTWLLCLCCLMVAAACRLHPFPPFPDHDPAILIKLLCGHST